MDNHNDNGRPRRVFALGQIVMTPGAAAAFAATSERPFPFLARHQWWDWGEVSSEDATENDFSVHPWLPGTLGLRAEGRHAHLDPHRSRPLGHHDPAP